MQFLKIFCNNEFAVQCQWARYIVQKYQNMLSLKKLCKKSMMLKHKKNT